MKKSLEEEKEEDKKKKIQADLDELKINELYIRVNRRKRLVSFSIIYISCVGVSKDSTLCITLP